MKKDIKCFQTKSVIIGEGTPKVCMPMVGKTEKDLMANLDEVFVLKPDVVEWRADHYQGVEVASNLLAMLKKISQTMPDIPLLFTCRDVSEGGFAKILPKERARLIEQVIDTGMIDLLDIELEAAKNGLDYLIPLAKKNDIGVVLSNHFFTKTPPCQEIVEILRAEQSMGADIAKIAVMPNSSEDVLSLLTATHQMHTQYAEIPLITMSMGQLGLASRVCGGVFGNALTFGAGRNTSAPGQIGIKELRNSLTLFHS